MLFPNFIGPTYQSQSLNADAEDCLNWYPEVIESGAGKNKLVYYRTPGTKTFCTLPTSPVRGIFAGENRLFVIAGDQFYEVFQNGTFTSYGSVGNDGAPVDLVFNGNQVLIASAGFAWVSTGGAVSPAYFNNPWTDLQISLGNTRIVSSAANPFVPADAGITIDITSGTNFVPGTYTVVSVDNSGNATLNTAVGSAGATGGHASQRVPAVHAAFLDSYFWVQASFSSKVFYISNPLDGTTWDPLQFASKEAYPDNIAAIFSDHEEMYIFGDEQSTEVWRANGQVQPAFPFQRDPNAIMNHACRAPYSVSRVANGVAWVAGDQARGGVYAIFAQGYQPNRISTHAVEQLWSSYTRPDLAVSFSEIRNGHQFWVVSFPADNATWSFDFTTQMWHRRGAWNGTSSDRIHVGTQCYVGLGTLAPTWYGGDPVSGKVYTVQSSYLTDDGTAIERIRQAPYLSQEAQRIAHQRFQLDMQGSGTVQATLTWSDDNGQTYSNPHVAAWSPTAPKRQGLLWRRLGQSRARIYKVRMLTTTDVALINAYVKLAGEPE